MGCINFGDTEESSEKDKPRDQILDVESCQLVRKMSSIACKLKDSATKSFFKF